MFAGEAIVDVAMRVPAFPAPGADVLADASRITAGGGFNVMAAAARQGLPVLYAGSHGTGPWGDLVRKALAAEGIEVFRDPDPGRDTGFAVGLGRAGSDGPDGERAYVTQLGAESHREPGCLDQVPVGGADAVYISGYGLLAPDGVLAAWAADLPPGALLFLDPGPLAGQIPGPALERVLPRCDWLSCNEREAALLTGAEDPGEAARALLRIVKGGRTKGGVIVRAGPAGCHLARAAPTPGAPASSPAAAPTPRAPGTGAGPEIVRVPAPAVTAVDTAGAGDAHAGVFLAALAEGLDAEAAVRRANAAAALAVTRPGPATAPTRAALDAWLSA